MEERWGMDVQTRCNMPRTVEDRGYGNLLLSANRKSYMPRRLAQQMMTLSDLEWPFHASLAISALAKLLVLNIFLFTISPVIYQIHVINTPVRCGFIPEYWINSHNTHTKLSSRGGCKWFRSISVTSLLCRFVETLLIKIT